MNKIVLAAVLLIVACAAGVYIGARAPQPVNDHYVFITKNCWFKADWRESITCGELQTPAVDGEFHLPVVIIHNNSADHRSDPLVYLTGGPGSGSRLHSDGIKEWLGWLTFANLGRDLILMDSRGTGGATPALQCAAYNRFNQRLLELHLPLSEELEQGYRIADHCFSQLQTAHTQLRPSSFGSQRSAADIRGLMAQLKYAQWNLVGVSYGTRLALEVARQEQIDPQPVKLRSLVLDSLYPAGYGGVQTWPRVLDEAFQRFFRECAKQPGCLAQSEDGPRLNESFMATLKQLQEFPVELSVRRWDGEAPVKFLVNDHRFLSASFAAIYNPREWPLITAAMRGVHEHKKSLLLPLIEPYINNSFSSDFNSLAFMMVDCADNPVGSADAYQLSLDQFPLLAAYTEDQWRYQICHSFEQKFSELILQAPAVPTLILSGALDPITPVEWASAIAKKWPNTQWLVRENTAHNVLGSDACVLADLRDFLDHPMEKFSPCSTESKKSEPEKLEPETPKPK